MKSDLCGALTTRRTLCTKTLACPHHREHCESKIRARAMARMTNSSSPAQLELELRPTLEQARRIRDLAYLQEKALRSAPCGCMG